MRAGWSGRCAADGRDRKDGTAVIGVDTEPAHYPAVREFFELFKTPWALYEEGQSYDVVLTTKPRDASRYGSLLTILFQGEESESGELPAPTANRGENAAVITYRGWTLPIYGGCVTYEEGGEAELLLAATGKPVIRKRRLGQASVVAIGFHLFAEVEALLTTGQPETFASVPTLDIHINLIRNLILEEGNELVEIPPVPAGYKFIACLTHDVDHPFIAAHRWDHTIFGFLFRATAGSLRSFIAGRMAWRDLMASWMAALKLPLVHLGLIKDFWAGFEDRFQQVEGSRKSTYFLIPFKGVPGRGKDGTVKPARAAGYRAEELKESIKKILRDGCEVGLHGIDAWCDVDKAAEEREEIRRLTGKAEVGVRMHWLYFGPESPRILERAGACYDSTMGYNSTIGYRSGTTQAYRPLGCEQTLELPLHAMDTAMFYPSYLHLTQNQGIARLKQMVAFVAHNGGTLTVNWHDRSLAPERLWVSSYATLIDEIERNGGWFATMSEACAWYQMRRASQFAADQSGDQITSMASLGIEQRIPGLTVKHHKGPQQN